jgi:hypothetical protein
MIRHRIRDLDGAAGRAISMLRLSSQQVEIAQTVLDSLARASACHWGAYWALDTVPRRLRPIAIWSASSLETQLFGCDLRRRPLSMSLANARQVWCSGKPLWSTCSVLDVSPRRTRHLAEVGLQAGVWFAVQTGSSVYGVIELRGRAAQPRAPDNLIALQGLGFRLGSAIEEFARAREVLH